MTAEYHLRTSREDNVRILRHFASYPALGLAIASVLAQIGRGMPPFSGLLIGRQGMVIGDCPLLVYGAGHELADGLMICVAAAALTAVWKPHLARSSAAAAVALGAAVAAIYGTGWYETAILNGRSQITCNPATSVAAVGEAIERELHGRVLLWTGVACASLLLLAAAEGLEAQADQPARTRRKRRWVAAVGTALVAVFFALLPWFALADVRAAVNHPSDLPMQDLMLTALVMGLLALVPVELLRRAGLAAIGTGLGLAFAQLAFLYQLVRTHEYYDPAHPLAELRLATDLTKAQAQVLSEASSFYFEVCLGLLVLLVASHAVRRLLRPAASAPATVAG
jgi:hypothetical protein